jgi:crossover junction endodeoxyribonuclease RusA
MLTLTLPYPPSLNHLHAVVHGRKVLSAKGRAYYAEVARSVMAQSVAPFGGKRISYTVTAFPPDNRRRDLSNLVKAVEDALTHAGVWNDDSQVDAMTWRRGGASKGGSLFVEIREA